MRACTNCGEVKPLEAFPPVRRGEPRLQSWCRDCFAAANARNYLKNHEREKTRLLRQVVERRAEVRAKIIEYLNEHPCVDCGEQDIVVLEFDHVRDKISDISTYASSGRTWARVKAEIDKCEVRCANCHRLKTLQRSGHHRVDGEPAPRPKGEPVQLLIESALGIRTCRVCGLSKPLPEFPFRSLARQTRQRICLLCQRAYTKAWYVRNREEQIARAGIRKDHHRAQLRARVHEYLREHPCVDCGETNPILLDFDHLSDKRGNVSTLATVPVSWRVLMAEIAKCAVRCANCHRRKTAREIGHYRLNRLVR